MPYNQPHKALAGPQRVAHDLLDLHMQARSLDPERIAWSLEKTRTAFEIVSTISRVLSPFGIMRNGKTGRCVHRQQRGVGLPSPRLEIGSSLLTHQGKIYSS